jgi:hypothetical protein
MQQQEEMRKMARLVDETADSVARGSTAGLNLLFAEMQALWTMMPGMAAARAGSAARNSAEAEARARQEDAEVESAFDNMPV